MGSGMAAAVLLMAMVLGVYMHGTNALVCTKDFKENGCNKTLNDLLKAEHFASMFKYRNDRTAHAAGFWSYEGFMAAAKMFEKQGFASVSGDDVQLRELARSSPMLGTKPREMTLCVDNRWMGACARRSSRMGTMLQRRACSKQYCKKSDLMFPCAPGAGYYGRGAFPLYWNYNYGPTGVALKQDLLHHPELLFQNETIAWQAAIWYWMTSAKTRPSPHQVMVGKWVPTKADLLAFRKPGFGMTINVKASDVECGHGEDPRMDSRISHYMKFLQILTENEFSNLGEDLDCGLQGVVPLAYAAI